METRTDTELKIELRSRGLISSGSRTELITRLSTANKKSISITIIHIIDDSEPIYLITDVDSKCYVRDLLSQLRREINTDDTSTTNIYRDVIGDCYRLHDEIYLGGRWRVMSGGNTLVYYGVSDNQTLLYLEKTKK